MAVVMAVVAEITAVSVRKRGIPWRYFSLLRSSHFMSNHYFGTFLLMAYSSRLLSFVG